MAKNKTEQDLRAGLSSDDLADLYIALLDNFNSLLAKLDDDGGVTDTDYESTLKVED